MEEKTIYDNLTKIFRDVFDDDTLVASPEMTAAEVPAWDSLSNIIMVVAVEQEFEIKFSTGEVAGLSDVSAFVKVIMDKKQSA